MRSEIDMGRSLMVRGDGWPAGFVAVSILTPRADFSAASAARASAMAMVSLKVLGKTRLFSSPGAIELPVDVANLDAFTFSMSLARLVPPTSCTSVNR